MDGPGEETQGKSSLIGSGGAPGDAAGRTLGHGREETGGKRRRPWLAVLLTLVVPGLGQVYNGQILKGVAANIAVQALAFLFSASVRFAFDSPAARLVAVVVASTVLGMGMYILLLLDAYRVASRTVPAGSQPGTRWYIYGLFVAISGILACVIGELSALKAYKIPASSMEPTLIVGDHILVDRWAYREGQGPRRGDIIVFVFPEDPSKDFIKRVVAGPGDTVEIRRKALFVNGRPVEEDYTRYADGLSTDGFMRGRDTLGPITVPAGKYFVMGDNRDRSYDSRFWGFVDGEAVIGKALFIYFSIDWSRGVRWYEVWRYPELVRWDRIGDVVR